MIFRDCRPVTELFVRGRGPRVGRGDRVLTFFWAAITTRACGWGLDAQDVRYRQFRACDRSTRGSPGSRANRGAQSFSGYDGCPRGKNRGGGAAGGGWTHRTGGLGGRLGGDTHAGGEGNVEGDGVHRVRVSLNGSRGRDDVRGERAGSRVWHGPSCSDGIDQSARSRDLRPRPKPFLSFWRLAFRSVPPNAPARRSPREWNSRTSDSQSPATPPSS